MTTSYRHAALALCLALLASPVSATPFEVWLVDQSNSPGKTHGGAIHVFDGADLQGEAASEARPTAVIDLGAETTALCMARTGAAPVRPHMVVFNSRDTHAALAFVASGHVVFFDARTRQPLECLRMAAGVGGARQAHAAWPTRDDRYVLVANQNGKRFERIRTDYASNSFSYEPAAALDLANGTTPNGLPLQDPVLRPDNAPICPFVPSDNGVAFTSLRGGGMLVIDFKATPMRIVGEYDRTQIGANGCGFIEAAGFVWANAGGGTQNNLDEFGVYRMPVAGYAASLPPNTPAIQTVFSDTAPHRDAHGVAVTRRERYVWIFDRAANVVEVFDASNAARVNTVDLRSVESADPTPDLVAESPDGNRLFVSLRGPTPLSGDPHSSTGSTPGLAVVQVEGNGRDGFVKAVVRITNRDAQGVERADAHGIRVRRK
jgi:hypothetical protein